MKFKFKLKNDGLVNERRVSSKPSLFFGKIWQNIKIFADNLHKSYVLMTKAERYVSLVLIIVAIVLIGDKSYQNYLSKTVEVPGPGGTYSEVMVGEVKFLNPVTARTDAEKSVDKLMFRGLMKITGTNTILPDIARSYTISTDGKTYTFALRPEVAFSDGQPLTANDVAYTIGSIQTPELKSPLLTTWTDVEVKVIDDYTLELTLPNAYGPFIYNCNFGIIPAHMSADDFSKRLIGSGPYQFTSSVKDSTGAVSEIELSKNSSYYGEKPYIENVKLNFLGSDAAAIKEYQGDSSVNGIFAAQQNQGNVENYLSSRQLGLIFNLRRDVLKDKAIRQKILTGVKLDTPQSLTLVTLNIPTQERKAEELKTRFEAQNIKINVNYLTTSTLQEALTKKNYDLLLYGFDFGFDRDPYTYWHTSQMNALNLAGWSDKNSDILMEDARMLQDVVARNAKYDTIYAALSQNYAVEFYPSVAYDFAVKSEVKGVEKITGTQPSSRFDNIEKWYIAEKRVKKTKD